MEAPQEVQDEIHEDNAKASREDKESKGNSSPEQTATEQAGGGKASQKAQGQVQEEGQAEATQAPEEAKKEVPDEQDPFEQVANPPFKDDDELDKKATGKAKRRPDEFPIKVDYAHIPSIWQGFGLKLGGQDIDEMIAARAATKASAKQQNMLQGTDFDGVLLRYYEKGQLGADTCQGTPISTLRVPQDACVEMSEGKYLKGGCDGKVFGSLEGAVAIYNEADCLKNPVYSTMLKGAKAGECIQEMSETADIVFLCGNSCSATGLSWVATLAVLIMAWRM